MSHKYDEDTEYHYVAYHMLLCKFMLFWQGDYSNSEYGQRFKEQIEVLEAYSRGVLFENSLGGTAREIATLGLDADIEANVGKSQVSERGKYLAAAFLLSSDRRRYGDMILSLNNYYSEQRNKHPKLLQGCKG